jgi:serine phosphatase RsbU (regulator of sigma subunit)/anti-sigma regulatory factor (Ser/Thr protein kinase)
MAERLHRLAHLTAALGDTLTVDDVARVTLTQLGRVEGLVRAGIALSEGAGRQLRFVANDAESLSPLGVRWCKVDAFEDIPLARTIRTGEPIFMSSLAEVEQRYPDLVERQRRIGARSMASVPILFDGLAHGGLLLSFDHDAVSAPEQQAFFAAFAAQVAQAVKRGLAYQVQHSTSEQLQRSLLPHALPDLPGLAMGAHYQPGGPDVDVGGDWYDVMPLDDGSVVLTLGDVMGKGVSAAIVMSEVRAATRAYALLDPEPSVVLDRLDRVVATMQGPDQVVTMLYGVIDPEHTVLRLGIAGHPPPLLVAPSGRPQVLDHESGPALGVGVGSWSTEQVALEPGASVLLYSDGLVESREQDLFVGIDRLRDQVAELAPRRRNPRELCARLTDLMDAHRAADDVTLLAVTAAPDQSRATTELPADPSAAGRARRFVADVLVEWSVDEDVVDTATLCVSELVTNAVIHSGTRSTVTVQADQEYVMVLVQDNGGRGAVRLPDDLDPESISGRGLSLVDALASAWSAEHSTDGTTVWFELPRARSEQPMGSWSLDVSDVSDETLTSH